MKWLHAPSARCVFSNVSTSTVPHLRISIRHTFRKVPVRSCTDSGVHNFRSKVISYPHWGSTVLALIFKVHICLMTFSKDFMSLRTLVLLLCLLFVTFSRGRKVITLQSCKQFCSPAESSTKTSELLKEQHNIPSCCWNAHYRRA
jgi:hypothetical protein